LGQFKEEEKMVILGYDVKTSSQRTFVSVQSTNMLATRTLRVPQNTQQPAETTPGPEEDSVHLQGRHGRHFHRGLEEGHFRRMHKNSRDESIRHLSQGIKSRHRVKAKKQPQAEKLPTNPQELKARLMQLMIEMLTGRGGATRWVSQQENESGEQSQSFGMSSFFGIGGFQGVLSPGNFTPGVRLTEGWRVEHFQYETEQVSYQAQGVVKTADGRTINVDINMFMSRQFVSYMGINVETTRPIDPLVINYGGTAASLMGEKFMFDLTMDGNMDSLSVLGEGSGFLAIDWNGDRKIHDGSQLFGPSTGCGFSELRKYDTDGNGWIDANDEIFDKLVVWHRDKDGNDTVYTLRELGIGAIFLGDIATEFSFKGDNNETLGIMRSTSFFLKQCGGAGTVSHIDMMV
jgi:hypothetical protein